MFDSDRVRRIHTRFDEFPGQNVNGLLTTRHDTGDIRIVWFMIGEKNKSDSIARVPSFLPMTVLVSLHNNDLVFLRDKHLGNCPRTKRLARFPSFVSAKSSIYLWILCFSHLSHPSAMAR